MTASVDIGNNSIVSIDDVLTHDQALETYSWLTPQILHRWRRERAIRSFKGRDGKPVYPKHDLSRAMTREMECESSQENAAYSNIGGNGSAKNQAVMDITDTGTMTEADVLRERLFLRSISTKPRKNSSPSLEPQRRPAKAPAKSISSMS
jgi:hypothetical protein